MSHPCSGARLVVLCAALALAACGGSVEEPDGSVDGSSAPGLCGDIADGGACGDGGVCVAGSCLVQRCGDGVVTGAEECDDGNETAYDGCEPETCTFTCSDDTHCDDHGPCNGMERCDTSSHFCVGGEPLSEGSACTTDAVSDGVCGGGECILAGCGNGVVDSSEDCDDGRNGDDTDGCRDNCTFTCVDAADLSCDDGLFCNGAESCDPATHTCQAGAPMVCTPIDACHTSVCSDELSVCVETLIDEDMDGEASTLLGECGTDCDDMTATRFSANPELCGNGIDDDCDAATSDAATTLYYPDCDCDTYTQAGATGVAACMAPTDCGTGCPCCTTRPPSPADCGSTDASRYPGALELCDTVDQDCNGSSRNTCPSSTETYSRTLNYSPYYGGTSGTGFSPFTLACDTDTALTGISGRAATLVDRVRRHCFATTITQTSATPEYTYRLNRTGTELSPRIGSAAGGIGGEAYDQRCPDGEFVVGLFVRSGWLLDRLSVVCGRVEYERASPTSPMWTADTTVTRILTAAGGTGGTAVLYVCPDNSVATQISGYTFTDTAGNTVIGSIRLGCRALGYVPQ